MSRTLAHLWAPVFDAATRPFQYALQARAGSDALAGQVRAALELHTDCTLVSLDGRSAYDTISRAWFLTALRDVAPELLPFVRLFYGQASTYCWWDCHGRCCEIRRGEGCEQGDPLPALPRPTRRSPGGRVPLAATRTPRVCITKRSHHTRQFLAACLRGREDCDGGGRSNAVGVCPAAAASAVSSASPPSAAQVSNSRAAVAQAGAGTARAANRNPKAAANNAPSSTPAHSQPQQCEQGPHPCGKFFVGSNAAARTLVWDIEIGTRVPSVAHLAKSTESGRTEVGHPAGPCKGRTSWVLRPLRPIEPN